MESDPIGLDGGLNTFGYVGGNPLIYEDQYGLAKKGGLGDPFNRPGSVDQSGRTAPTGDPVSGGYKAPRSPSEQMGNKILDALLSKATAGAFRIISKTGELVPVTSPKIGLIGRVVWPIGLWGGGTPLSCSTLDCGHPDYRDAGSQCEAAE